MRRSPIYLEILLDWAEGSRPFFVNRAGGQKRLIDLVECFLTPAPDLARNRLRVYSIGQNLEQRVHNPYTTQPGVFRSGSRLVFSWRDNLSVETVGKAYSSAFLAADRSVLLERWNIRLHNPIRLPAIYEPASAVSIGQGSGRSLSNMITRTAGDFAYLLASDGRDFHAVDIENWGRSQAVLTNPLRKSFSKLSCISADQSSAGFYLIADGQLNRGDLPDWNILRVPIMPGTGAIKGRLKQFQISASGGALFQTVDDELQWATHSGTRKIYFRDDDSLLQPRYLNWLLDGSILFTDRTQQNIWMAYPGNTKARRVFGPVDIGPLYFCIDKRDILYVLERLESRLHVFLPSNHWVCNACGEHRPDPPEERICPDCRASISERKHDSTPFTHWFDLDLSTLGTQPGPICVDDDLNLYIVTNMTQITALPLSRRDLWGEKED